MTRESILRVVTKLLVPYILLFALYVQFHGDYGPGGGFQAGVIFAAGLVLYSLVFGLAQGVRVAPPRIMERVAAVGVLLYGLTGVGTMVSGGRFLEYGAFNHHHPQHGEHLGIFLVELGVGIGVTAVITSIFFAFAERRR